MTFRAEELLKQALALPVEDRADVAAELLASLEEDDVDDPADVAAAWAQELEARARRVLAGESNGEPWRAVRDAISGDHERE